MSVSKKNVRGKRCFAIQYYIRIYEKKRSKRVVACEMRYDKSGTAEAFLAATLYLNKNKGKSSAQTLSSNDAYGLESMYMLKIDNVKQYFSYLF